MTTEQANQWKRELTGESFCGYEPTKNPGEVRVFMMVEDSNPPSCAMALLMDWDDINKDYRKEFLFQNSDMDAKMKVFKFVRDVAQDCKHVGIPFRNSLEKAIQQAISKGLLSPV